MTDDEIYERITCIMKHPSNTSLNLTVHSDLKLLFGPDVMVFTAELTKYLGAHEQVLFSFNTHSLSDAYSNALELMNKSEQVNTKF